MIFKLINILCTSSMCKYVCMYNGLHCLELVAIFHCHITKEGLMDNPDEFCTTLPHHQHILSAEDFQVKVKA